MISLRTPETDKRYDEYMANHDFHKTCPLCVEEPVQAFQYWKIIANDFPYDKIASKHDMLVLNRHAPDTALAPEEEAELKEIKLAKEQTYDFLIEGMREKSVPGHFHVHLLVLK